MNEIEKLQEQITIRDDLLDEAHKLLSEAARDNQDKRLAELFLRFDRKLSAAGFFPHRTKLNEQNAPVA